MTDRRHVLQMGALATLALVAAPAASRRALRRAEVAAVRSHSAAAVGESDQERAQLLALIAASEAQHAVDLAAL